MAKDSGREVTVNWFNAHVHALEDGHWLKDKVRADLVELLRCVAYRAACMEHLSNADRGSIFTLTCRELDRDPALTTVAMGFTRHAAWLQGKTLCLDPNSLYVSTLGHLITWTLFAAQRLEEKTWP